jgi:hypothetical protein
MYLKHAGLIFVATCIGMVLVFCNQKVPKSRDFPVFDYKIIDTELGEEHTFTNVADINGDNNTDVLAFKGGKEGYLSWYESPGFTHRIIKKGDYNVGRPLAVDVDLDGDPDLVVAKNFDRGIYWYENPLPDQPVIDGNKWMEHLVGSTKDTDKGDYIKDYAVGDFDGDGRMDIVVCTFDDPAEIFLYYQNSKDDWFKTTRLFNNGHEGLDIGDLDGDGDPDVVLNGRWFETPSDPRNNTQIEHEIDVKWHNQPGTWQKNATMIKVVDVDANGQLDVIISHSELEDYPVSWYSAEDPKGRWTEHFVDTSYGWCQTLDVGDVDLDGDLDILAARFTRPTPPMVPPPHDVRIYYNNGNGLGPWKKQIVSGDKTMYFGHLADMGNDGDLDIVGPRSYWTGPIEWWENQLKK